MSLVEGFQPHILGVIPSRGKPTLLATAKKKYDAPWQVHIERTPKRQMIPTQRHIWQPTKRDNQEERLLPGLYPPSLNTHTFVHL